MTERICIECSRTLQKSVHDKCMFCGALIPEDLRLTDREKAHIKEQQDERRKRQNSGSSTTTYGDGGFIGGDGFFW